MEASASKNVPRLRETVPPCYCDTRLGRDVDGSGLEWKQSKAGNEATTHSLQTAAMPYASMALLRMRMATSHVMPRAEGYGRVGSVSRARM